ncbi:hypothetical protein [uncultured Erythrobacter sp.]|uniref:hypothetical protein n=1 Tax=uncultured Erythrobacter sp. TaxID=263913 RepID=UPI00262001E0|nr:hypothetical protein [uncultured Erythrobacter sp.]
MIDFVVEDEGQVTAKMAVTGRVGGRFYVTRIGWRGIVSVEGDEARVVLDEVLSVNADPLPGNARWSDPEGDVISLQIEPYSGPRDQNLSLTGFQETELGTNNMKCRDSPRV